MPCPKKKRAELLSDILFAAFILVAGVFVSFYLGK